MAGLPYIPPRLRCLTAAAIFAGACTAPAPAPEALPAPPRAVPAPLAIPAEPVEPPRADQIVLAPQLLGEAFIAELATTPPDDSAPGALPAVIAVVRGAGIETVDPQWRAVVLTTAYDWRAHTLAQTSGDEDPSEQLIGYLDRREGALAEALPWPEHGAEALVLRTRIRHLDFASGPGVRYLAAYAADVAPLAAGDLFYVFEGLTRDGRYHVGFQFPVATALLTDRKALSTSEERAEFAAAADEYAARMARSLAEAAPSSFQPSLERLDAFARSITVR